MAVDADVNSYRPLFTGDIFADVDIPGVGCSTAIVIGHPCSIRRNNGILAERTPVASVETHGPVTSARWSDGYFSKMPLAGLPIEGEFHVARLDLFGLALTSELVNARRLACLSHPGINQLQQRLVFHHTRLAVPTDQFQQAFDHTYEEADLLEEWITELAEIDDKPESSFECWIREGSPNRQSRLEIHEERASIRREMRQEIERRSRS
ncbi:MAG: hypothetical protein OXF75_04935 [Acidimicrobiaceae bacterium]|nr:hypothetical protein [Acidimicrobiaceae bacterium]